MNGAARPSEDDLHAYVDGRLDAETLSDVQQWLEHHPEDAHRVHAWVSQHRLLRTAFDPVLAEPVPDRLRRAAQRPRGTAHVPRLAATLAWIGLGTVLGYAVSSHTGAPPSIDVSLPHTAAIAHVVYTPEVRHPVEVGADQEAHLVQWLSKRLGAALKVPALGPQGYRLVGGRLLPGAQGAVAQFMYEDDGGKRLTLYVRSDAHENHETAFRFSQEGNISVFYWLDGQLGYALSGELPRERLLEIAETAYRQLNP